MKKELHRGCIEQKSLNQFVYETNLHLSVVQERDGVSRADPKRGVPSPSSLHRRTRSRTATSSSQNRGRRVSALRTHWYVPPAVLRGSGWHFAESRTLTLSLQRHSSTSSSKCSLSGATLLFSPCHAFDWHAGAAGIILTRGVLLGPVLCAGQLHAADREHRSCNTQGAARRAVDLKCVPSLAREWFEG